MKSYTVKPSDLNPEVIFDPLNNKFEMSGSSRPEDVRELYYPMLEWFRDFRDKCAQNAFPGYTKRNPLVFKVTLDYFNSSSAKFLYDIFEELNTINQNSFPVEVHWYYNESDEDMRDAGEEMQNLVELEFRFIETFD